MLTLLFITICISFLLCTMGLIKPKWITVWKKKECRDRKAVLVCFGGVCIGALFLWIGLSINWLYAFVIFMAIVFIILFITFITGLISPAKVFVVGKKTRIRVLFQHGLLFVVSFTLFLIIIGTIVEDIGDDEILPGATYEGEFQNGLKEGYGKAFNNSSYYEGEWVNDKRNGYGVQKEDIGVIKFDYDGEWENNLENGQGKKIIRILWIEMVYEGEWKDGIRHGYGTFIDRSGNIYEGEWKNDQPHGVGKMTLKNGETYDGEVLDWKRHGYGKAVDIDGEVQEGLWENDKFVE